MNLELTTAGESHGKGIVCILEGFPAGVEIDLERINKELARRQIGYGRGGRMEIEKDAVEILSGMYQGETIGTPISLFIENKDWANWKDHISPTKASERGKPVTVPRPGHADLAGCLKYGFEDCRKVLERSSARETAGRVAAAGFCRELLDRFGISTSSRVTCIGSACDTSPDCPPREWEEMVEGSSVRTVNPSAEAEMKQVIDQAARDGDSLGGTFELAALGLPPGLGGYSSPYDRLDSEIARRMLSIPAIKAIEIGLGAEMAGKSGSEVHDEIFFEADRGFYRETNRAGGLEGGVTNGEPVRVRVTMKPIPTLSTPLRSVDLVTKEPAEAAKERADVCAVPAASIVGEAELAMTMTDCFLDKFGGDSLSELERSYESYMRELPGGGDHGG